mmetsp:Transcript_7768/g.15157  ORF Transcript_7768/g.15157 Transcript_7768/m.15157 type:complete len:216 (+) Transcript_7768:95-742(+)
MGGGISKLWNKMFKRNVRIFMVGLDAAGKTTVLFRLKLGDEVQTIPTIGFHVEKVDYKNISFHVWDLGGQEKIRSLWSYYISSNPTDGIIFVVDSSDKERVDDAKTELHRLLHETKTSQQEAALLVLANKQDIPGALSRKEIIKALGLEGLQCPWHVQSAIATRGEGLLEGIDWLAAVLNTRGISKKRSESKLASTSTSYRTSVSVESKSAGERK